MNADELFISCHKGNWKELSVLLNEQIRHHAESGNVVLLCRALSYHGVCSLLNGDDFSASTLYKQIKEEYADTEDDPKIKASYARFLALYHSFFGSEEAAVKYYREASLLFPQTDLYQDEAMTLLESAYMCRLFSDDKQELRLILQRLDMLNDYLGGYLDKDLTVLKAIAETDLNGEVRLMGHEKPKAEGAGFMARIFMRFITDSKELKEAINTLGVKALALRHPWYSSRFSLQQSAPTHTGSAEASDREAGRVSIRLFDKACLCSKKLLSDWKT